MACGVSNGHVIDDVTWHHVSQRWCEAVRSAILATGWLLVVFTTAGFFQIR